MGVQINGDTGNISAIKADYSGNVTIGGTLTYEDVTNIDSVGLVTARSGIEIGARPGVAASISVDGNMIVSGITTIGGDIKVGSGVTVGKDGDIFATGVTTSSTVKVGGGVTISESGIEASGIGITCANINGGQIGGRRNIIINGAMNVAQRGTSSTSSGYQTTDRFQSGYGNFGINMTQSQQSLSSSDTGPYGEGFRNYKRVQLAAAGNANANAYVEAATYKVEAQDLANSGWDPASATNFITLSFWFRCSTNQTFLLNLRSEDGTSRMFSTTFTASANNTWTKIVKTIPGNTSPTVDIDNDNGSGLAIFWVPFYGTDYTDSGSTMDAWKTYSGSSQGTDMASTWLAAGASTFDITGVQLEVGPQATAFEHRSFGEELQLCRRYFQIIGPSSGEAQNSSNIQGTLQATPFMRANPSIAIIDNSNNVGLAGAGTNSVTSVGTIYTESESLGMGGWVEMGGSGFTANRQYHIYGGKFSFSSEL